MNISRRRNDLAASRSLFAALIVLRLKMIFKSLCFKRLSPSNDTKRDSSSPSASNRFDLLGSLQSESSESDACRASGINSTEANETDHEHSEIDPEKVEDDGIKDDVIVQDLELHFALWVCSAP